MQQTQDFSNDLIQIYRTPCPFAFADEMMDSVNDIACSTRIRRNIIEQLFKHWEVRRTLLQKSSASRGVAGNGGPGPFVFLPHRTLPLTPPRPPSHLGPLP